jgi:5'-3' exonuclease
MYFVLHKMPVYDPANKVQWESKFCKEIAAYMRQLIDLAAPTKGVYISCDGVVCAAKRRQQRLRRFKGPWLAVAEAAVRSDPVNRSGWDQNALTPGSAFMALLGDALIQEGRRIQHERAITVIVSTTDEPGEGEHKLLAYMRQIKPATCTIYGLDADLILLSMLLQADTGADVVLMREAQEFERDAGSGWRSLGIRAFVDALLGSASASASHRKDSQDSRIRDFVATMSLLGNDFLPRPLSRTVRDDGISELITGLQECVWGAGRHIVGEDGRICSAALELLLKRWAQTEEVDMLNAVITAARAAGRPAGIGESPDETAVKEWNAAPARWASLCRLFAPGRSGLRSDWRTVYREQWHAGSPAAYLEGVAWVWDYYSGRAVDQGWMFEPHLPPLWSDLVSLASLASLSPLPLSPPPIIYPSPLPAWLHLLAVLPAESVERLLSPQHRRLMAKAPWYWPTTWSLFDIGRTQLWECEPVIPILPDLILRSWI